MPGRRPEQAFNDVCGPIGGRELVPVSADTDTDTDPTLGS